jgi:hypothetical protein
VQSKGALASGVTYGSRSLSKLVSLIHLYEWPTTRPSEFRDTGESVSPIRRPASLKPDMRFNLPEIDRFVAHIFEARCYYAQYNISLLLCR